MYKSALIVKHIQLYKYNKLVIIFSNASSAILFFFNCYEVPFFCHFQSGTNQQRRFVFFFKDLCERHERGVLHEHQKALHKYSVMKRQMLSATVQSKEPSSVEQLESRIVQVIVLCQFCSVPLVCDPLFKRSNCVTAWQSAESICDQHCTLNSNWSQTSEILSKSPATAISVQTFLMM